MRFGLLGTGYWAAETHGAALAAHPEAELVGVWGRDAAKAEALATRYGARAYTDADELIADVDAVAVALPPDVQAELATRAADAGRHLLLDKPLALTTEAADRLVEAVDRRGTASVVFFTNRFHAPVDAFLRDAAEQGGWFAARATMFASIFRPGNPYGASPWRREAGGLWDVGPHALSLLLPVLGPAERVTALDGAHGSVQLLVGHRDGAVSSLALTLDAPEGGMAHEFTLHGAQGAVTVPGGGGTAVEAMTTAIGTLLATVRDGAPGHPCDVHFGREVVRILQAADRSRREGVTVRLAAEPATR
ncbi:Gfo/Idh/MocA family protein [Allostreptomyces psammosilenae]|uniref:Putative dehydrogenase n=1 Tax=Allostreptomyces psammosilenae TaxID=1892865 RepID=A0A853A0I0_9ACTN|nr:Gfo/Idh/MocA family oxidoreductase [Allostreptomyces psammosilenae]NYI04022.1 putative dehydrogenase [Allostreptomyces psammosilenae]